jgi:hypothetical protein
MSEDSKGNEHTAAGQSNADVTTAAIAAATSRKVSRRALLGRSAAAAVPAILTLQSGAAQAASSNILGTVSQAYNAQANGKIQCVDAASAVGIDGKKLDLGNDPMLHVQYVTSNRRYYRPNSSGTAGNPNKEVTVPTMCSEGGVFWYKEPVWGGGTVWKSTTPGYNSRGLERGFLVSATALSSFASDIRVKTNF